MLLIAPNRSTMAWVNVASLLAVVHARADWVAINLTPTGWTYVKVHAVTVTRQFGEGNPPGPPFPVTRRALGWSGSPETHVNMSPGTGVGGGIHGASGQWQVGTYGTTQNPGGAALWMGGSEPVASLHPTGYWYSVALAVADTQQGGYVSTISGTTHAAMWHGSAASFVNMNPPGALWSALGSIAGDRQGGTASFNIGAPYSYRAGIWSGAPATFVSIHPGPPYLQSGLADMTETEQVGVATGPSGFDHAALWYGTAASFVDLDPGWDYSRAFATIGGVQVGWTTLDWSNNTHAVIWFGSAATYHPLSQYLPPGYHSSVATSIATDGHLYYVGGYASPPATLSTEAFLWVAGVPGACYANCDLSTTPPVLNLADFSCFLQRFAAGNYYANCDGSTQFPALNVGDFSCFLSKFVAGCP